MSEEGYPLEQMWLSFQLMQSHRGEFDFAQSSEFYDMVDKCSKIVNKALSVKGVKRRQK